MAVALPPVIPARLPTIVTADEVARKEISAVIVCFTVKVLVWARETVGSKTMKDRVNTVIAAIVNMSAFPVWFLMMRLVIYL